MDDLTPLIVNRLEALDIKYEVVSGSEWIKCQCINPEHDDANPSAGINVETAVHHCFSCGHSELFIKQGVEGVSEDDEAILWSSRYNGLSKSLKTSQHPSDNIQQKTVFLPPKAYAVTEEWRGISADLLQKLGVYYCNAGRYKGRYVFPIFDKNGVTVGFDARIVDDTALVTNAKWLRPTTMRATTVCYPYNMLGEMLKEPNTPPTVLITEGIMDAVSYLQLGVPAIPSFGIAPPSEERITQLLTLGVENVVLAFDNDEAGANGMMKVLPHYAEWFNIVAHPMVAMVRNSGYKDCNDFIVGVKANGLASSNEDTGWDDEEI